MNKNKIIALISATVLGFAAASLLITAAQTYSSPSTNSTTSTTSSPSTTIAPLRTPTSTLTPGLPNTGGGGAAL